MKTLITPARVVELAFDGGEFFSETSLSQAVILSAQHKFIEPVLGGLYGRLLAGDYPELLEEFIAAPLALYVKWLLLPSLSVQSGALGVVQMRSVNFQPATQEALTRARRRLKADAQALMRCAVEHIEQNPHRYPAYTQGENARSEARMTGGIVF